MSTLGAEYNITQTFIIEPVEGVPVFSACTGIYSNILSSCSGNTNIFLGEGVISFDGNIYTNDNLTASTIHASAIYSAGTNVIDIINLKTLSGGTFDSNSNVLTLGQSDGTTISVSGFKDYYTTGTTLIGHTVYFNRNDTLSAYTLNLSSFSADTYVTGVTFTNNDLIIARNDGVHLNTFINTFTGLTINGTLSVSHIIANSISANTISATTFYGDGSNLTGLGNKDTYVTGGTYNDGTATFTNNTGGTFNVTGFYTGYTAPIDIRVTGGTYNAGTAVFTNNTGGTFNVTGFSTATIFTGGTVSGTTNFTNGLTANTISAFTITTPSIIANSNGLTATTISATTYLNLPVDIRVTGGTYSNGAATFTNNTGGTFSISGLSTPFTGGVVSGLTATTISATTYENLPLDIHVTGLTFNNSNYNLTVKQNDGSFYTQDLSILSSDVSITGGTYNPNTGIATFTNNTGGTFSVSGFLTGHTDTYVTAMTFTNNVLTVYQTQGNASVSQLINNLSGLTVNGSILSNTISATTYQNLPTDIRVTGGTYSSGTATFTNNTGGTFSVTGFKTGDVFVTGGTYSNGSTTFTNNTGGTFSVTGFTTPFTGGTVNGLTATTISATTYQNLPKDIYVTGGTYSVGTATFTNNSGGTFNVTGFKTNDVFVTGGTYSNGTTTFTNNTGGTFNITGFTTPFTGGTVSGSTQFTNGLTANTISATTISTPSFTVNSNGLTATTISATTYQNLPKDIYVTGGTYSVGTAVFTNITGGTFSVTGFKINDIFVTGGTPNNNTRTYTFTNNTGGTFTVTSLIDVFVTGGTYSSGTITLTNNTGGTFNVTGLYTGNTDVFVTGGTYNNGTTTFTNNTGGTFNVIGFTTPFTGGTVSGPTQFTNGLTANTISATTISTPSTTINSNGLTATTISATTYLNLPKDIFVTGGTYSSGTATFTNITGGTFSLTGFSTGNGTTFTGGTVSGATNFTNGLTANTFSAGTISVTNYIDFNTGTTTPSNVSGRVYYDNQSHALAYFPDINQNVKVEVGQQLYIRGYNATGTLIPKGSALSIQSATNGLPNFTLAANVHAGHGQLVGLAASDIPNANNGLALSQGILSGLTLNTFSVGDILYVSPFSAGTYVAGTSSFPFTARTNQVGYVIATGTSTGEIYVSINNEDENLTLTDIERNILEGNVISTGLYNYTGMTQGTGQTINIAAINGWIAYNTYTYATLPDVREIIYTGGTNIPLTYLNTADSTYILINSASTIVQQTTFPTPQQRRQNIYLGKIVHPNRSTITSINQTVDFDVSPMSAIRDLWTPLKLINQGIIPSPNGVNLSINTSAGVLWGNGIGWVTSQLNPDSVSISGTSPTTFQYRTQLGNITGGTAPYTGNTTFIDPAHYDNNGVVTNVGGGSNSSTNQRIYIFPTGLVRIQYGQTVYSSLSAAVAGSQTESFVEYANNRDNGILIGILSVIKNATQLSNSAQAVFNLVSKFGESLGGTGGLSTTTLQQAYDNSTSPEIVINATLDGLTIQNGTGNPDSSTHLLEGKNTAGATTFFITASGGFSGTSITANTISGTTYQNLPTDIRVTGGTYSSGTATFTNNTGGTFTVTGFSTGGGSFTGGTVSGQTQFTNGLTASTISATTYQNLPSQTGTFGTTVNNQGSVITTGTTGYGVVPFAGTITNWYLVGDVTGSTVFDLWRNGTSIIGTGNTPTLSNQQTNNAAVSGWTSTSISTGDVIQFIVSSASTITVANLVIKLNKS